jgi:GNAT superfamily N-acetyltransferase
MARWLPDAAASVRRRNVLVIRGGAGFIRWDVTGTGWYVYEVASIYRGRGIGTALLLSFLGEADNARVAVVLHCKSRHIQWYRRHGFRLLPPGSSPVDRMHARNGLVGMHRPARHEAARTRTPSTTSPASLVKTSVAAGTGPLPGGGALRVPSGKRVASSALVALIVLTGTSACRPLRHAPAAGLSLSVSQLAGTSPRAH